MAFRLIDMESWPRREFYEHVGDPAKTKKAYPSARKEITLDLLANHSNDQGLLQNKVGFHHLLNLRFL